MDYNKEGRLTFVKAFDRHNIYMESAIKSLDNLNDQIVQFIFTPKSLDLEVENELSPQDHETLKSSMTLMRRLLIDAQTKFRKMMEDNRRLASRIDGSIYAANQEVNALRLELNDTNRKLGEISDTSSYITPNNDLHIRKYGSNDGGPEIMRYRDGKILQPLEKAVILRDQDGLVNKRCIMDQDSTTGGQTQQQRSNQDIEEIQRLTEDNAQLQAKITKLESHYQTQQHDELAKVRDENQKYEQQVGALKLEIEELRAKKMVNSEESKVNELKLDLIQCKQELNRAKEALHAMKADRKRLKAEKLDLLGQLKELYNTLEDKEAELRNFIRNYEQRMKESDESLKQLAEEKDESEREKWEILKRARDAAERAVSLRTDCDQKDKLIKDLQAELGKARQRWSVAGQYDHSPLSAVRGLDAALPDVARSRSSMTERTPPPAIVVTESTPSPVTAAPVTNVQYSGSYQDVSNSSTENLKSVSSVINSSEDVFGESSPNSATDAKKRKKRNSVSSFSKLFPKSRSRRSIAVSDSKILEEHEENLSQRLILNDENYHEKLQLSSQAKNSPIAQWKANQVLAWLEIEMNMPMYGKLCAENIKSGKVILGLSNSELESALGITNHFHRRKLRLAVEEYRDPSVCKYPKACCIDYTWVAHKWVHDLGIPQYSAVFESQLTDGRMLNSLTKKDIEKYFGIQRKFHQISILHAVELLRRVDFDKEVLVERRAKCEHNDTDLLVWTNQRLIQWVQDIDLQEYASNLRESGVHGAMIVLEPTFTMDTMAAALGIPPSKQYIRRHLMTELYSLIKSARTALDASNKKSKSSSSTGSLGRSFSRSFRHSPQDEQTAKKRMSFRRSASVPRTGFSRTGTGEES